jgi:hypothetical protein
MKKGQLNFQISFWKRVKNDANKSAFFKLAFEFVKPAFEFTKKI